MKQRKIGTQTDLRKKKEEICRRKMNQNIENTNRNKNNIVLREMTRSLTVCKPGPVFGAPSCAH